MPKQGKKYREVVGRIDRTKFYEIGEAISLVTTCAFAKFDETLDVAVRLGVNPKHADQMVRGAVVLPHGTGRSVRLLVFAKGEKEKEATEAGADIVGGEDLIAKIQGGWMDFEKVVATPDMMGMVGKLGKLLGPRGLMPSPKVGTVTFDVAKAVREVKAGKVEFRVDKEGIVHAPIGKVSFGTEKLKENLLALLEMIQKLKPPTSKGAYFRSLAVSSTMGPGLKLDLSFLRVVTH